MGVKLFLIRHGQTEWNLEGRYQGSMDTDLTETGKIQARLAKEYLEKVDFSNIYSSPLRRAIDTAKIIADGRQGDIKIKEELKELNFGKWEGLKFGEIDDKFHEDYQDWLSDPFNNKPTGGESFKQLLKRVIKGIDEIIAENEDGSDVAVVAHGGVIVALLVHWLKIPKDRWRSVIQRQSAINVVVIDNGFPYISQINFTGHLGKIHETKEDKVIEIYTKLKKD